MTSIMGAVLTAGYAAAIASQVAASPQRAQITSQTESTLQKSFSSAEALASQYPHYQQQIIAAAKTSFLDGANWAYAAGIIAAVLGMLLVLRVFPARERERELMAAYAAEDATGTPAPAPGRPLEASTSAGLAN